jgi:hypothetical protein
VHGKFSCSSVCTEQNSDLLCQLKLYKENVPERVVPLLIVMYP